MNPALSLASAGSPLIGAPLLWLEHASFEQVVGAVEQIGANQGHAAAIDLYSNWIALHGKGDRLLHAAWFNLGVELSRSGDLPGAVRAYRAALVHQGDFAPAAINLGLALEQLGQTAAALQVWDKAIQPTHDRIALLNHRARLLEQKGELAEAEALLRGSLLTDPAQPDAIQHWVHIRQKMCNWPALAGFMPNLSPDDLMRNCGPLAGLALTDSVDDQRAIAANWLERKTEPAPRRLSPPHGYRHDRIRIGYLSSDFCRHAMSYLIAELFERHDRERFEVYGYCSSPDDGSKLRQRVTGSFDYYRRIRDMSDAAAAQLIRGDEIDILVDLNGLTSGARLQILRWRPAPLQATYLGFIGPVPLPELDYLFCDTWVIPPEVAAAYAPQPLYIARNYQANDRKRVVGDPMTRAAVGLPDDRFVCCCFSNYYKITPEMFAAWMSILRRAERAVLWLIADHRWGYENLRNSAAAAGVDPDRLIFTARTDPASYMARLALADLFLDTFPYNAGTIASDAMRMGLPLLTRQGQAYASRMAGSLLHSLGADEGIALSTEDYVEKAIRLATDPETHRRFRTLFAPERWAGTVGDIAGFTAEYETTLVRVYADLCAGGRDLAA